MPRLALIVLCAATAVAEMPPLVPGFEQLRSADAAAGEVLLSELSCLACHRAESPLPPALEWKAGPLLGAAGDRLRAGWVRRFLENPAATRPGATMPNLLAGQTGEQRAELAENLTHFLLQLRAGAPEGTGPAGVAATGDELFHSVGCVACHGALPLPPLGEKYAAGQLAQFLLDPLEVRPAGRMPDLHLTAQEAADLAAYLSPDVAAPAVAFVVDAAKAQRGAQAFVALGCVACHGGGGGAAPALAALAPERGCLAESPPARAPRYALTPEQRTALRATLAARRAPEEPAAAVRRVLLQRNCFACHAREGLGGPAPEVAAHFTSRRDDLGDQGRLPPPLDGVGRKLQPAALADILRGRDAVRTYLRVRMPDFGPEFAEHLSALFIQADADAGEKPTLAKTNPNQVGRNEAGREMVGTRGFSCISCHDLHGHASLGIGAYDLAAMPRRLRPEWMRDFLLDPAAFPTGARMPAFWPAGKPLDAKRGESAERQIDSIRVYLSEADQSLPPEGFHDPAASELKPIDRPIVFRTFMENAGTHAVAVGFPQGVHAAFDALHVRWSIAWRGRFLDADGTWHERVAKIEKPLGDQLVRLEKAGALVLADSPETAPRFCGYRLDAAGVPTFLYDLGALRVEDRLEPAGSGLRRTLRVYGQTTEAVDFRAEPPAGLRVQITGSSTFPLRLHFHEGIAELVEELSW